MRTITNKVLSERLSIPYSKVRRYALDLFAQNSRARARSGFRRELTIEQAFTIFLATFLVAELAYSSFETKTILRELEPWLKAKGLFPRPKIEELPTERWQIKIIPVAEGGFLYKSVETIRHYKEKDEKSGRHVEVVKFVEDFITRIPVGHGVTPYEWQERIFPISLLLAMFTMAMRE
jgi:hypothetical protein